MVSDDSLLPGIFESGDAAGIYNGSLQRGNLTVDGDCSPVYRLPMQQILASFHNLMFRNAYYSELGTEPIIFKQTVLAIVYLSKWGLLSWAVILVITAVNFLGSLLWGWWDVEDDGGLGPLDFALVFSSPLLNGDPRANVQATITDFGQRRVRTHDGRLHTADEYEEFCLT